MYYEFTMLYKTRVTTISVERQELADQLAYCRKGKRAGWLLEYAYKIINEDY